MSWSVIVAALGAFLAGGVISLRQQRAPLPAVIALAVVSAALLIYGAWSWFYGMRH